MLYDVQYRLAPGRFHHGEGVKLAAVFSPMNRQDGFYVQAVLLMDGNASLCR